MFKLNWNIELCITQHLQSFNKVGAKLLEQAMICVLEMQTETINPMTPSVTKISAHL